MPNTPLALLQRRFSGLVTGRSSDRGGFRAARVAIYADGFEARLHGSLEEDFPAVASFFSSVEFTDLLRRFLKEYPSREWTLARVSRNFPEFLRAEEASRGLLESSSAFLPELADLEWRKILAFLAEPSDPLDMGRLQEVAPEELPRVALEMSPSAQFLNYAWPVHAILPGKAPPEPRDTRLLVHCVFGETKVTELSLAQWELLHAIGEGDPIGKIFETQTAASPEEIFGWFSVWAGAGIFTGFHLEEAL